MNVKGVFDKLKLIQKELDENLENAMVRDRNRILYRQKDLIKLIDQIDNISNNKNQIIGQHLNYKFSSSELVIIPLIQPEMKNLFQELQTFFNKYKPNKISNEDIDELINLIEVIDVLALTGDAAIDLALLHKHWDTSNLNVEDLNCIREQFAGNNNLAIKCEKWKLWDYRLKPHSDLTKLSDDKIITRKATMVEALFGVIYIEKGLGRVISSVEVLE